MLELEDMEKKVAMLKLRLNKRKQADEVATDAEEVINADVTNLVVTDTEAEITVAEEVDVTSVTIPETENVTNTEAIETDAEVTAATEEVTEVEDDPDIDKSNFKIPTEVSTNFNLRLDETEDVTDVEEGVNTNTVFEVQGNQNYRSCYICHKILNTKSVKAHLKKFIKLMINVNGNLKLQ